MATLAIVPCSTAVTESAPVSRVSLYDLETHLAALLDTEEQVPAALEEEYALDLCTTMLAATEKRDRVGQFMAHLEAQIAFAKAEIKRLQERQAWYTQVFERMEGYVSSVIESLGRDGRGKRKKLEGTVVTFALHGCDKRAEVTDEKAVPPRYKRVTVTLPLETWDLILDSLDLELRAKALDEVQSVRVEVSTSRVKADLKAEIPVPGAELAGGAYLVRS